MRTLTPSFLSLVLVAACGGAAVPTPVAPTPVEPAAVVEPAVVEPAATVEEARAFVAETDRELRRLWVAQAEAEWEKNTNITPATEDAAAKAGVAAMTFLKEAILRSRRFDAILAAADEDTRRQIALLRIAGIPAPADPAQAEELAKLGARMEGMYGKGKACEGEKCRDLGDLEDVFAKSRDPKELLSAWTGWHGVGAEIRPLYSRFVELTNIAAKGAGFADVGDLWRSGYDMTPAEFEAEVERLWQQVRPLYEKLHCYTRRKLSKAYGADVVAPTGPMPAHVLGNMWAQAWGGVYPMLEPHAKQVSPDVTPALVKQKYDHLRMVQLAEGFFTSLGLDALPKTFYERSMFLKPEGRDVVCHASAWDVGYNGDLRIKMCIKPNQDDLVTIHHELGHNYYYQYYFTRPMLYQAGAHDGFHEAIGDTIALSITPSYLKKVGLLAKTGVGEKAALNQLMFLALDKVAFLPFGLALDKWRWDVYAGKVAPAQYNAHWWELKRRYQGIVPPVVRTEENFDPGAKYHVPANVPYVRYFLAHVLQFQLHRALCKVAGQNGPLHECSIHGSKPAGDKMKALLSLGASRPWPEALEVVTGQRQMDATAMLEYFAPLSKWLDEQNSGQTCGW